MARTTLTIDDTLFRKLRRLAADQKLPFKVVVERVLRAGFEAVSGLPKRRSRFKQRTFDLGAPVFDVDKALQLAGDLETEEILRKRALRK